MMKSLSISLFGLILLASLGVECLSAQFLNNATLSSPYHLVVLEVDSLAGSVEQVSQLGGKVVFDGAGGYMFTGETLSLDAGPMQLQVEGTYTVSQAGVVVLSHPARDEMWLRMAVSDDLNVLLGATSGTESDVRGFAVAVLQGAGLSNQDVQGTYTGGVLEFPNASPSAFSSSLVSLSPNGAGGFTKVTVIGNRTGSATTSETMTNASYLVHPDGSGTTNFGATSSFLFGAHKIYVSANGKYVIGYGASSQRSVFVSAKNHTGPAEDLTGRYWTAEMLFDGHQFTSGVGAIQPDGDALVLISEEVRYDEGRLDFSGLNFFATDLAGKGWLADRTLQDVVNMHLAVTETDDDAGAMVGAQVGAIGGTFPEVGLFLAVRAPEFDPAGLFAYPSGVVNGASFALLPNPVAPGSIVSLFGLGFLPPFGPREGSAAALPLPLTLLGLSVTVNDEPAPLFFTSDGQVNLQIPYGLVGDEVTVRVTNAAGSREVIVPLAPTSPGVFSYVQPQSLYAAIVTHADGGFVTIDRPAAPGETVVIYVTGLGELTPAVATGAATTGLDTDPHALAVDPNIFVLFNQEFAEVSYAGGAPGFAGLNQINATIPLTVVGDNVVMAIATTNAFHDQTDIPVGGVALPLKGQPARRASNVAIPLPPRARGSR